VPQSSVVLDNQFMLSTWRGREADWLVGWCRFGRQVDSSVALPLHAGFLALKKWAREGGQDPPGFADHSGDRGAVTMPKNLREGFEGQVFCPVCRSTSDNVERHARDVEAKRGKFIDEIPGGTRKVLMPMRGFARVPSRGESNAFVGGEGLGCFSSQLQFFISFYSGNSNHRRLTGWDITRSPLLS